MDMVNKLGISAIVAIGLLRTVSLVSNSVNSSKDRIEAVCDVNGDGLTDVVIGDRTDPTYLIQRPDGNYDTAKLRRDCDEFYTDRGLYDRRGFYYESYYNGSLIRDNRTGNEVETRILDIGVIRARYNFHPKTSN